MGRAGCIARMRIWLLASNIYLHHAIGYSEQLRCQLPHPTLVAFSAAGASKFPIAVAFSVPAIAPSPINR
jgi:hypothetical protein